MLTSVVLAQQSSDNYTMLKNVLSNGGNKSSSANYQLVATVGQNATQKSTANGKVLYSGFYAPMGTQQPIISGTVLNEDTDAGLENWEVKLKPTGDGDTITTKTNANGGYKFEDSYSLTTYQLFVVPKEDGWKCSFPDDGSDSYLINLAETQVFTNKDFRYDSEAKVKIDENGYFCITGESNGVGYSWRLEEESDPPSCVNDEDVPITCQNSEAIGIDAGQDSIELATDFTVEIMKASQYGIIPNKDNNDHRCFNLPVEGTLCVASKDTVINDCNDDNACKIGEEGCTYNPTIRLVESSPEAILSVAQTSHNVVGTNGTVTFDVANAGAGSMGWIAEANDSWLTIESGNYGKNNGTITVHYSVDSDEERVGTITIVAPGIENGSQVVEIKTSEGNQETGDYTASGTLKDNAGQPIANATVQIGDKSVVTDTNGNWEITGLANGEYTATATKDGIKFESQNLVVNGENITLNLEGEVIDPGDYTIYGTIRDELDNKLDGVEVQVAGQTVTTDAAGNWIIPNLQEGEYTVVASKDSYTFASKNIALGNDAFRTEVVIVALSKLKVTVVTDPRTVKQGDNVTYIITVINGGDATATEITLTDVLPENAGLVSIEALDGGECDANTVTCTLPDLTTGNSARVKLVVSNTQAKSLLNTATVTTNEYPADVQKTRTRVIPYLAASITDSPEPLQLPLPGEERMLHYDVAATLSANAPSAATGVNLVMTLPKGVELQAINSDAAMCDVSNLPTITCQVTDLSVDNADSISHVTVGVDVALKDAGLLTLTLEAKLSANEYPVHTDKERTKIFIDPEYKVGLALVIDDSGSMQGEINQVKAAANKVIDTLLESGDTLPLSVLLTFGDQVKYRAVTQDVTILRDAIAKIKVSGGGTCPEASFEAISFAIPHLIEDGTILFATDASPYEGSDTDDMIARLRSNAIVFNALIFGDCSDENSWNQ
jgi:uncharacterized repeat protein (TIGR01451 family)